MSDLAIPSDIEIYVPDGVPAGEALARTTHAGIGAHQDDLEINMVDGILQCHGRDDRWFFGIVATDGRGSPRSGSFADLSDDEMVQVRRAEQRKAADIGQYSGVAFLPWRSGEMKDPDNPGPAGHLLALLTQLGPDIVYTHNLMDKHDTHVAVALRTLDALRRLPASARPEKVYGMEGWRDLDWLADDRKILLDCSGQQDLQRELVAVFESQIAGGKRYDLAALGRRQAHATGQDSHAVDHVTGLSIGIDMTPLMLDESLDPAAFATGQAQALEADIRTRIRKLS